MCTNRSPSVPATNWPFIILVLFRCSHRLQLPPKTLIHPVVHVSLLRQAAPPESETQVRLPPALVDKDDVVLELDEPLQVLQRRQYLRGSTLRPQVLIQWSSMSASLATWEDEAQLKARFPSSPAWGQAGAEGEDNVTPVTSKRTKAARPRQASTLERTRLTSGL